MGVQGFQEFVEKRCPGAVVPVDLLRLARAVGGRGGPPCCSLAGYPQPLPGPCPPLPAAHSQHAPGLVTVAAHSQHAPGLATACPARLLVDADSALQRLYGGYQTDWVCGGQWNAMVGYLAALSQACLCQGGLELAVIFNGGLGKERLPEWGRRAQAARQTAQLIAGHVSSKGTPPPRAWFLPPACLGHCIRLAMIRFRVQVFQSLEDHHLEVVSFFRERGFHGLLAHDAEFALASLPCYFSAQALKLSWNGKSLTTNQFLMHQVAKQLGLKLSSFPIFAALLGNHILPDEDLAAFHWSLLGPDHPLASLKVRAHQLVLPPCDVVIKAVSEYVGAIAEPCDLDAVGRDVFKHSQIEKLDARGVQLAALFMSGVDTALLANDACGQPVPWEHCCPWIYFDGKLFQTKLIRATRDRAPLIDLCDGQAEQAAKVERMRQSILEGVNLNRQAPPPLLPPPPFMPAMATPFYSMPLYPRTAGSVPLPPPGRSRGFTGLHPIPSQGGKLEIAGMVVGQWAGSKPWRGRGSFGMQVVSVGGPGKGRSRDGSGKLPKGNKKLNKQGSSEGAAKVAEMQRGQPPSQVNGGEESGGSPCPPAPSPSALARDTESCSDPCCGRLAQEVEHGPEAKLPVPALQKEE